MKRFFAILMAICLMASALSAASITASAAEEALPDPAAGVVLRISALKEGGSTELIKDFNINDYEDDDGENPKHTKTFYAFEDGWNYAMEIAGDEDEMEEKRYDRVVVDLYNDWIGVDSEFSNDWFNGDGFKYDTIYIPEKARVTINLNENTIDRNCAGSYINGEVICIADDADVIINNGKITGGYSDASAGGIYIMDDAKVTLNNVNVVDNITMWDGGGITVSDGAVLTVNGGSFINNAVRAQALNAYGGAVYVEDATAIFNGVEFKDNEASNGRSYGAAIYADDSEIVINNCIFDGNGIEKGRTRSAESIIHSVGSTLKVTGSAFTNNGGKSANSSKDGEFSAIFKLDESDLIMDACEFSDNLSYSIIVDEDDSFVSVSNTSFLNNKSDVMYGDSDTSNSSLFNNCKFDNNVSEGFATFYDITTILTFYNCSMGNSTFNVKDQIKFVNDALDTNVLIRISAIKKDGTSVIVDEYKILSHGWDAAMDLAADHDAMNAKGYARIVVDLLVDWNTKEYGVVTIPEAANITLNLNGHTIDRGLGDNNELNGEVIYIDDDADVIINGGKSGDPIVEAGKDPGEVKMGTITGGNSDNGAGGIHVKRGVHLTLNNVHVDGNTVDDDNGAGIAIYDGSTLVMNGGSLSNNSLVGAAFGADECLGGGLYIYNGTAILDNVEIKNNQAYNNEAAGMAIYACESEVALSNCIIDGNGLKTDADRSYPGYAVVYVDRSELTVTKTRFTNNGVYVFHSGEFDYLYSTVIGGKRTSDIKLDECTFEGNGVGCIFYFTNGADSTQLNATECEIVNNRSSVHFWTQGTLVFEKCTFNNNKSQEGDEAFDNNGYQTIILRDCSMGDSDYREKAEITFENSNGSNLPASIFGEGSLSMIVAFVALIVSVAGVAVNVSSKKKAAPVAADNTAKSEDEE